MVFIVNDFLVLPPATPNAYILVTGEKAIDMDSLWKAIRKLSSENSMTVLTALCKGGKTFRELQTETGLIVNDLNHILYDMKQMGLIITRGEKKGERTYHITSYCSILLNSIQRLQDNLQHVNGKDIFDAII